MEEYLCLTVVSQPGESEADFKGRLSRFWTSMLRNLPDEFEKVYAEARHFEAAAERRSRSYLIQEDVVELLERELKSAGLDWTPIDRDDFYSKHEAIPSEWMQIEH